MAFTWDPKKDDDNYRDHKMHLKDAEPIFFDPFRVTRRDDDSSISEERYQTIGMANKVLFVVYTERGIDDTHIISARTADPKERRIYHERKGREHGWVYDYP